jgi:hypothetical protein
MSSVPLIEDDPITDGDALWRRVLPTLVVEAAEGTYRVSSAVFQLREMELGLSVGLARLCAGPHDLLAGHESYSLCEFFAVVCREAGLQVRPDPRAGEPWHAVIEGNLSLRSVRKALARNARWVVLRRPDELCSGAPTASHAAEAREHEAAP